MLGLAGSEWPPAPTGDIAQYLEPYPVYARCMLVINIPEGKQLDITMLYLDIDYSTSGDSVRLYDDDVAYTGTFYGSGIRNWYMQPDDKPFTVYPPAAGSSRLIGSTLNCCKRPKATKICYLLSTVLEYLQNLRHLRCQHTMLNTLGVSTHIPLCLESCGQYAWAEDLKLNQA